MATFVSLATCHHCPVRTSRRGLVYMDSLSALSRSLRAPGGPERPPSTRLHRVRVPRRQLPESFALTHCETPGGVKLLLTHLRKLLLTPPTRHT